MPAKFAVSIFTCHSTMMACKHHDGSCGACIKKPIGNSTYYIRTLTKRMGAGYCRDYR